VPGAEEVLARAGVSEGEGPLLVSDTELSFGHAVVGHARPAKLALGNTGPALALRFEVSGPFSVDVAERTLGQGERMDVVVSFMPRAAGAATGELRVLGGGEPRRVALVGKAVESCPESHVSCKGYQVVAGACVLQPLADGSACGPETCGASDVCRSARCVRETPPEGTACKTACGGAGTCQDERCQPPGGEVARELWSHALGWYKVIHSNIVMDAEGSLYFRECLYDADDPGCELVALNANGTTRYRLADPGPRGFVRLAVVGDQLVAASWTRVLALRTKDGAVLFERELEASINSWSHDGGQRLFFALSGVDQGLVLALDASTGAPLWRREYEGLVVGAVSDEQGNLYFAQWPPGAGQGRQWVVSLNGEGQERWRRQLPLNPPPSRTELAVDPPRAVSGGTLMLHSMRALSTADGSERFTLSRPPSGAHLPSFLVMNEGLGTWWDGVALQGFDPVSGGARWTYKVKGGFFGTVPLTLSASSSTLLVANAPLVLKDSDGSHDEDTGYSPSLCEVSATGSLMRELSLPAARPFVWARLGASPGRVLLMRWNNWTSSNSPPAYQLHLFEVPGLAPASGWSSEQGGPFGGSRPW
jgi:outer membrane protein assembly factor BamB